jgi:hypothetical protein
MTIHDILRKIETAVRDTFAEVDTWFDKPEDLRRYKPAHGGWSINENLEHIALTSHFLLILIEKGTRKALQQVEKYSLPDLLKDYSFSIEGLDQIGQHMAFEWIRPTHMEPAGIRPLTEIRQELKEQADRCLHYLHSMPNGEGVVYKTTMTVNNLGKIDVYQYIYFLAQHAGRHITQMQKVQDEFTSKCEAENPEK